MKKRFSVEQIVAVQKQAELGLPVADLIRQVGISEQTFYRWKKLYGGLGTGELRRLKQLEEENRKLKQLVAASQSSLLAPMADRLTQHHRALARERSAASI